MCRVDDFFKMEPFWLNLHFFSKSDFEGLVDWLLDIWHLVNRKGHIRGKQTSSNQNRMWFTVPVHYTIHSTSGNIYSAEKGLICTCFVVLGLVWVWTGFLAWVWPGFGLGFWTGFELGFWPGFGLDLDWTFGLVLAWVWPGFGLGFWPEFGQGFWPWSGLGFWPGILDWVWPRPFVKTDNCLLRQRFGPNISKWTLLLRSVLFGPVWERNCTSNTKFFGRESVNHTFYFSLKLIACLAWTLRHRRQPSPPASVWNGEVISLTRPTNKQCSKPSGHSAHWWFVR